MQARIRLLSRSVERRLTALGQLDGTLAADGYAARRALVEDSDGRVRAEAARFLGKARGVSPVLWLLDATHDDLPSVREAAARALGQQQGIIAQRGLRRLSRLALLDPVWWVRRTAALSLAQVGRASAIAALKAVLGDPFWRVRHAAVQALTVLWQALPEERDQILQVSATMSEAAQGAHLEVLSRVAPSLAAYKALAPAPTDQSLTNPDPAVTTARLRARPLSEIAPAELLPLLADPHTPLRELAIDRLARLSKTTELEEVLPHMVIPGLPHALESAAEVLDRTGKRAATLTSRILHDHDSPVGAVLWACRYLQRHGGKRSVVRLALQHPHPVARLAAVRCLDELGETEVTIFERLVEDEDAEVRGAALQALVVRVGDPDLGRYLPELIGPDSRPVTRLSLLSRTISIRDRALLLRLADDEHPLVRARALRALGEMGRLPNAESLCDDPDPLVRQAVMPWLSTQALCTQLGHDPDPMTRREALRQAYRRRDTLTREERQAIIAAAVSGPVSGPVSAADPWLRARVVPLLSIEQDLPLLLTLARDRFTAVRQAAAAKLDGQWEVAPLLRELLVHGQLDGEQRAAAYAELLKVAMDDPEALDWLQKSVPWPSEPAAVRPIAEAVAVLSGQRVERSVVPQPPAVRSTTTIVTPQGPLRRQLGSTDLWVSPLAISGVTDLPPRTMERALAAGANLFFWEPGYEALTRLIAARRQQLLVVTGSYEGDRRSIVADVEQALRRLRTDHLDVFLLFWVRSPERLSDEVRETLHELKRAGKIRACGFSTHDRELASLAIRSGGWDVLMTRHSAAHPGAEQSLFPLCAAQGTGLLTFSATSYGRLLQPLPGQAPPTVRITAADCYRYSMAQAGVSSVISAPRYPSELYDNLAVLADPLLPEERRLLLRLHGDAVHALSRRFNALVRKGHESPLHAPNEPTTLSTRLAELLAEHPAPPSEPLAAVTARRHSRTGPERRS